jgi:PilZ domain
MTHNVPQAEDRRNASRYRVNLPLVAPLADREVLAYTRDVSNLGVYFFVDAEDGDRIQGEFQFLIDLPPEVTLSTYCRVRCLGLVVRKENTPNHLVGIGARILEYSVSK